jgi:putative endonuclease
MLRCRDGTLYTGATNNLERRVAVHGRGRGAAYTRARLPVMLVWSEPAADRSTALRREAALKRLSRAEKLLLIRPEPRRRKAAPRKKAPGLSL